MGDQYLVLTNNFGEEYKWYVSGAGTVPAVGPAAAHTVLANNTAGSAPVTAITFQNFANALPAKAGVTALTALSGGAALSDVITAYNALLAALKVVS